MERESHLDICRSLFELAVLQDKRVETLTMRCRWLGDLAYTYGQEGLAHEEEAYHKLAADFSWAVMRLGGADPLAGYKPRRIPLGLVSFLSDECRNMKRG